MKVVIVNAYGRSNRGDSVLLDECISEIKEVVPGAELSGVLFEGLCDAKAVHPDVEWHERIGNSVWQSQLGKLQTLFYLVVSVLAATTGFLLLLSFLPSRQKDAFFAVKSSDLVVSAPGGYIHDTNFAYYIAILHIWLGVHFGKKVVLAPQSIGPIDSPMARRVARWVLSRVDICCVRESYSYNFMVADLKVPEIHVKRAGDSAFWNSDVLLDSELVDAHWRATGLPDCTGKKVLGITVVDWSYPKQSDPTAQRAAYIRKMACMIDSLVAEYDVVPIIFNQVSDDLNIAWDIVRLAESKVYIDERSHEPKILRALISRATVFIGTRFHSCIFAILAGRPTVAISYLPKTTYILEDLRLFDRHVSINDLDEVKLSELLRRDLNNVPAAEQEVRVAVATYKKNFLRLSNYLRTLL